MYLFLFFLGISIVNVILSTIKSLCTIRCGRTITIIMNVICYGFYTIVVKNTATLPLTTTVIGTMVANALGVWLSYIIMDKVVKDKLWRVDMAVNIKHTETIHRLLTEAEVPHCYNEVGSWTMFNCYCETHKETEIVKNICKKYKGKISAYESKNIGI